MANLMRRSANPLRLEMEHDRQPTHVQLHSGFMKDLRPLPLIFATVLRPDLRRSELAQDRGSTLLQSRA